VNLVTSALARMGHIRLVLLGDIRLAQVAEAALPRWNDRIVGDLTDCAEPHLGVILPAP
jgi:hypothetical protein